jgi:hypothetical protein
MSARKRSLRTPRRVEDNPALVNRIGELVVKCAARDLDAIHHQGEQLDRLEWEFGKTKLSAGFANQVTARRHLLVPRDRTRSSDRSRLNSYPRVDATSRI